MSAGEGSEDSECIGMCEFDPDSGVCLGCGRLPECTEAAAAAASRDAGGANASAAD